MDPSLALEQVRRRLAEGVPPGHSDEDGARRQWWAALATLQEDFLLPALEPERRQGPSGGLWLSAPLPALYEPALLQRLEGWVWAPEPLDGLLSSPAPLLPAAHWSRSQRRPTGGGASGAESSGEGRSTARLQRLPLQPEDGTDPLLVVITPALQVALCLDGPPGRRRLVVRFEPAVLSRVLALVHARLSADGGSAAQDLRQALQQLGGLHSDAELGLRFWPRLAERLSAIAPSVTLQPQPRRRAAGTTASGDANAELALLEALTHEVRTPLATIRTLIRSLLRRRDLGDVVRQRLEQIDGECSEQIDRFGLIFLAAELQQQPGRGGSAGDGALEGSEATGGQLARTDLSQLLRQLEPLWQRQLARRDLSLQLQISANLPAVLSDPARLEMMLGGLIDRFSRGLPAGSGVTLALQPAGSRLKLQLRSGRSGADNGRAAEAPRRRRAVGPVLSWDPGTGSLQLSHQATQQLFRRLGGRLTERGDNGLTVFFPVC